MVLVGVILILGGIVGGMMMRNEPVKGASFPGSFAANASSSRLVFSGSDNSITLFATTTGCVSRIITTATSSISFTIDGTYNPTGQGSGGFGHIQEASTTVAYDSGLWGCGRWKTYPNPGGTVVNATQFTDSR